MKKKLIKGRKAATHGKPSASAKRCDCCSESPCTCPPEHGHKK